MEETLEQLRKRIDALDRAIVEALGERSGIVQKLAGLKLAGDRALRDSVREEEHLAQLTELAERAGVSAYLVRRLFREIIDHALRLQQHHLLDRDNPHARQKRRALIGYQGTDGSYSQIAAEQHFAAWAGTIECRGYPSFLAMLQAVSGGAVDYGMLPIENTTAGSINEAYDLLAQTSLAVVGEEVLRVEHCLVGLPGAEISEIRRVYSQPPALAQCTVFLAGLQDCAVLSFTDTAMSVQKIRDEADPTQAAIASRRAAALYGLEVLASNVENQKDNFTRFMVVARSPLRVDERIPCKTSLIFSIRHEQGALVRCLNLLADGGLNLTKLESRPRMHSPFEYLFYVDFEGNLESEAVQHALAGMREHTAYLKILGCYPSRTPSVVES